MHVAVINTFYYPAKIGGAERSVQILAEALVARGHQVSVLCTSLAETESVREINGVRVYYRNNPNVYTWRGFEDGHRSVPVKMAWHGLDSWNPFAYGGLVRWLEQVQPEVLHTNNLSGVSVIAWQAARRLGVPVAHTLRDFYLMCLNTQRWKHDEPCESACLACAISSVPKRLASRSPDAVIGISRHILGAHLQAGFFPGARRQAVIYNAVVPRTPETGEESAAEPGARPLKLAYIGRIHAAKGVELLLEEFSRLPAGDFQLTVNGDGDAGYLRDLSGRFERPHIRFHQFRPLEEIYEEADATVVPSLWPEPFGRVVVESFSFGRPVIASRRGALPELIEQGATGFFFDPATPGDLAAVLGGLTRERCRAMRAACLARLPDFAPDRIAAAYEDLFAHLNSAS